MISLIIENISPKKKIIIIAPLNGKRLSFNAMTTGSLILL